MVSDPEEIFKNYNKFLQYGRRYVYLEGPNFIFIPINKVASKTFHRLSRRYNGKRKKQAIKMHDKFTFTILRHPLHRFVSGYTQLYELRHRSQHKQYKNPTYQELSLDKNLQLLEYCIGFIEDRGFFDRHILPQSHFLYNCNIDYTLQFETLNKDFQVIRKRLKWESKLPHVYKQNKNSHLNNIIKQVLTNEQIKRLHKLYEDDWELYNQLLMSKANAQ